MAKYGGAKAANWWVGTKVEQFWYIKIATFKKSW